MALGRDNDRGKTPMWLKLFFTKSDSLASVARCYSYICQFRYLEGNSQGTMQYQTARSEKQQTNNAAISGTVSCADRSAPQT